MQESDSLVHGRRRGLSRLDAEHHPRTGARSAAGPGRRPRARGRRAARPTRRAGAPRRRRPRGRRHRRPRPGSRAPRRRPRRRPRGRSPGAPRRGAAEQATAERCAASRGCSARQTTSSGSSPSANSAGRRRSAALARCGRMAEAAAAALDRAEESLRLASIERDRFEPGGAPARLGALHAILRDSQAAAARRARRACKAGRRGGAHDLDAARGRLRRSSPWTLTRCWRAPAHTTATRSPADRARRRARRVRGAAGGKVVLLGAVNPLPSSSFRARGAQTFLTDQSEDLRACKADLLRVVAAVDDRIREIFRVRLHRRRRRLRRHLPAAVPGRRGPPGPHRPRRSARQRRRRRGAPAGQARVPATVAAVGRRAVADRAGGAVRHLHRPALAVLRARRGGGGPR